MGQLLEEAAVEICGGFTAKISDLGDHREIAISRRANPGPWVYREVTLASLAACVERFTRPSSLGYDSDQAGSGGVRRHSCVVEGRLDYPTSRGHRVQVSVLGRSITFTDRTNLIASSKLSKVRCSSASRIYLS